MNSDSRRWKPFGTTSFPWEAEALALPLREHVRAEDIQQRLRGLDIARARPPVSDEAVEELKFSSCVPNDLALAMLGQRSAEPQALQVVVAEAVRSVSVS